MCERQKRHPTGAVFVFGVSRPRFSSSGNLPHKAHRNTGFSGLADTGVGVVIVDTLLIFRLHLVPEDVRMLIEPQGDIPN